MERYIKKITPQPYIKLLDIHLAEHCNLHCYSCSNFSQLADKEFPEMGIFKRDINRLWELTEGYIGTFNLLGGEPLLNEDILEYIKVIRSKFKTNMINIVTNGILILKKSDEFFKEINRLKVRIVITKYPGVEDYEEIELKLYKNCVNWHYTEDSNNDNKVSYKFVLDLEGKQNELESFVNCYHANNCVRLKDGRIYTCPIPADIHHFNKKFNKNLEVCNHDSIDIYKAKNYNEVLQFLSKPIPFCRYCNIKETKPIGEWRKSDHTIKEYTLEV